MKRKKGFGKGFFKGMNLQARLSEVAFLTLLKKYRDEKKYLEDGYDAWADFCNDLGISDETLRHRFKAIESVGPDITSAMISLGFSWRDVRAIDHVLTEDQRKELKKGVLVVDDKKIPVTEDHAPDVQQAFDLLIARADSAVKGEKLAKSKLEGIEKEHKKEVKAMQSEIEGLRAMLPRDEDDTEWAEKFLAEIDKKAHEFDFALRTFAFRKGLYKDPVLQAKVIGMNERVAARFRQFERDFEALILEGLEE